MPTIYVLLPILFWLIPFPIYDSSMWDMKLPVTWKIHFRQEICQISICHDAYRKCSIQYCLSQHRATAIDWQIQLVWKQLIPIEKNKWEFLWFLINIFSCSWHDEIKIYWQLFRRKCNLSLLCRRRRRERRKTKFLWFSICIC